MLKNLQAASPETPETRKIYYFAFVQPFSSIKRSFSSVSSGNNFYHHVVVKNFTTTYLNLTNFSKKYSRARYLRSRTLVVSRFFLRAQFSLEYRAQKKIVKPPKFKNISTAVLSTLQFCSFKIGGFESFVFRKL